MSAAPVARRLRALSRIGACAALTGACGFPCDEDTAWDRHVYHLYTVAESDDPALVGAEVVLDYRSDPAILRVRWERDGVEHIETYEARVPIAP